MNNAVYYAVSRIGSRNPNDDQNSRSSLQTRRYSLHAACSTPYNADWKKKERNVRNKDAKGKTVLVGRDGTVLELHSVKLGFAHSPEIAGQEARAVLQQTSAKVQSTH